jgi:DNA-binding MarR family transcriptional regulator
LVEVRLDQQDIRKHVVELTEAGKQKVAEVQKQRRRTFEPLGIAMPQAPEKIRVIQEVLQNAIRLVDERLARVGSEDD